MMQGLTLIIGIRFLLAAGLGDIGYTAPGFSNGHLTAFEGETSSLDFGVLIDHGIGG